MLKIYSHQSLIKSISFLLFLSFFLFSCTRKDTVVHTLNPEPNSRIVFIGNTFTERLQYFNYFETFLYKSFPERNLTVRNLGWSADEINLQPRPLNFGTLDEHLTEQQADIIFACYGLNEAFDGPDSLETFKQQLSAYLQHIQKQQYNGTKIPEIILVSPIAHEKMGGFLPDPSQHNKNLELYTKGMAEVAKELKIPFIDLFEATERLMNDKENPLTINGIHLNDKGYRVVSETMAKALDLPVASWSQSPELANLKRVIDEKSKQFFYKYRAVNGEYIYGRRKEPWVQPVGGPISYPSEFKKLDRMILQLDTVVWAESKTDASANWGKVQNIINDTLQFSPLSKSDYEIPSTDQFTLPEGYEISLFADEMDFPIANPVKITFDPKGRLWVASMPSYPQYYPGAIPNDKIIILEDTDGDGKADKHTLFADSLYLPLGFELGDGGAYVTQAPDLLFLKDTDGDGKADFKKILLHGFGTEDIHHSISAQTWGPDGALYFHMGTFLHTQVETPYGPKRGAYGTTWRFEPHTMKLEPYVSYPYANPWGNVFTRDGTHLIGDVSTGMNYFAPPLTVAVDYPIKHTGMKDFLTSKVKPKTCGMEIISSRNFPENVQGNVLFNTFIGFQGIRQHSIIEDGSGIIGHEEEPLLQSSDPNFRPVDLQFGPDGALYVVDWFNPIINHGERALRDPKRDHTHGRIWRITYKNNKLLPHVDLTTLTVDQLLDQLKVYEDRTRYRTRMQLREIPENEVFPALEKWLAKLNSQDEDHDQNRLEGLWLYQQFNRPNEDLLSKLLKSKDYHVRAAATRVLYYWSEKVKNAEEMLISMSQDTSMRVRLEAIIALSHFNTDASVNALLATTALPVDDYIQYALQESFKQLKPVWMAMFKKDKNFLENEPEKAKQLLQPLSSAESLDVPGFIKDDPLWPQYARAPLSPRDFASLADVPAVTNFLSKLKTENESSATEATSTEGTSPKGRTIVHLATLSAKMRFDKESFTVQAGDDISLVFENPDDMAHNVVIAKPGSIEVVGQAADAMASSKDGYEKGFVPTIPEVLFATPLINGGKSFQLDFKAPDKPGEYPFVCTFPGHWQMMKGIMKVVARK